MSVNKFQTSLTAGEISPTLFARVDLAKYDSGAALLANWFVDYRGGASTRAGTLWCGACKFVGANPNYAKVRLIPFIVSSTVAYVLEVGAGYIRFIVNGGYLGGGSPTEVVTPYGWADLTSLKYTQSADVMTFTHSAYTPYELTQVSAGVFTFAAKAIGPVVPPPANQQAIAIGSTTTAYRYLYIVTAVAASGEESTYILPAVCSSEILNQTTGKVNKIFWTASAGAVSYKIYKAGPTPTAGNAAPSTVFGYIGPSDTTYFIDNNIAPDYSQTPPIFNNPFISGQIATINVTAGGTGYTDAVVQMGFSGGGGAGATAYGIVDTVAGTVIGVVLTNAGGGYTSAPTATTTSGGGTGATFAITVSPSTNAFPYCSAYFQQRQAFGGSDTLPESLILSQTGLYNNYNSNQIVLASDAIQVNLASRQVNTLLHLVPMNTGLVTFTTGGAFLISGGGQSEAITPSSISALPQACSGANNLVPLVINYDILYGQNRGNVVRDLSFNFYLQSYSGTDRSVLASHLFTNYSLVDWTYAEEPFRLVHAVRNDGQMLILTYVPEQEIFGWTHWTTNGAFISVASIPEGNSNAVYCVVQRTINGTVQYYTERFDTRLWTSMATSWPLDCAIQYTGGSTSTLSGLGFLEAQSVYVLNQSNGTIQGPFTVTSGTIHLTSPVTNAVVGLPFTAELQTLSPNLGDDQKGTTQGRRKQVPAVTLRLNNTALQNLVVGSDGETLTVPVNDSSISAAAKLQFFSGDAYTHLTSRWLKTGQIYLKQTMPYPATVLGIIPEVLVGDNQR